ncbi:MAG: MFS-type bicyclomycin resistance protein [Rickettsiaceae bacterium]|jgi:DHA1 family bicyclomycin/chloramphenicol resistance-like MFS transporter|nr:MFS-type bicyclomycin resistance protein [Rickettsiaceae bacterium]
MLIETSINKYKDKSRFLLISISLMLMLSGTEVDLFIPSFPELQSVFNIPITLVQLTLSVNFIAFCVGCIFAGSLGDRFSRRNVIIAGLVLFSISSLICTLTQNFNLLLLGRLLQGLAIAPISVLCLVVVSDEYPIEKQQSLLGMLNGLTNFAMSLAPILGSYITLFFGWRGNFAALLIFSLICLILSFFLLPKREGDLTVSLSMKSYIPLIKSYKFILYNIVIAASYVPFWVFISISPILFMKDMGVRLEHFGFYQSLICGAYALVSLFSPILLDKYGRKACFNFGMISCFIGGLLIAYAALSNVKQPLILTISIMIYTVGTVFPINIIYPSALKLIPNTKGKSSAVILSVKWIFISSALWITGLLYNQSFQPIGLIIIIFIIIFFISLKQIIKEESVELFLVENLIDMKKEL